MGKTATELPAHAANYPPSAADRWLSCPASIDAVKLYDNDESDAALKGTIAHAALENGIFFGIEPETGDIDIDYNIIAVLNHVRQTKEDYGEKCQVFVEQRYDIPQTGEFGTCDVTFVTPSTLHVADYKNGFVPVYIEGNPQLMLYLLGAIAKFGKRKNYIIELYQPNYDHIDGPYRRYEVTDSFLEWFEEKVDRSIKSREFYAGEHCKKSYCPHRGNCQTFIYWGQSHGKDAFFPSDINALTDDELAVALDHAEILAGLRDELRKEAMRRIINMDKQISGYKVTKGRKDRQFKDENALKAAMAVALELGASDDDLYEERKPTSVAGFERFFKKNFKRFGNGAWQKAWDNAMAPFVNEYSGGLTLVRAVDGRPAHSRGSEFGSLVQTPNEVKLVI